MDATDPVARPHHPAAAELVREQTRRVGAPRATPRLVVANQPAARRWRAKAMCPPHPFQLVAPSYTLDLHSALVAQGTRPGRPLT
eukprot:3562305-Alexandrium_andersonii.AAC.1